MCEFYDPQVSDSCREPIADSINDKERANFCGYFKAKPFAYQPANIQAQATAQTQLNALFGEGDIADQKNTSSEESGISSNEKAKQELNDLFNLD